MMYRALALLLFFACALAQPRVTLFDYFELDGNATLSEEEFRLGLFDVFDDDKSGFIDDTERSLWVDRLYGGSYQATFGEYDNDNDGRISADEFNVAYDDDLFTRFDADGNGEIGESEFAESVFAFADVDGNEVLRQDEVETYATWWLNRLSFKALDTDADGDVSKEEFALLFAEDTTPTILDLPDVVIVPFGNAVIGEYQPIDDLTSGSVLVQTRSPAEQAIDVVLIGPYGYKNVLEVESEELVEALRPGTYVVAATDDDLEMVSTKIAVNAGQSVPVTLTLSDLNTTPFTPDLFQPYGFYEVGPYGTATSDSLGELTVVLERNNILATDELIGSIIGPDDFRYDISGLTEDSIDLDNLLPGTYLIAVTGEGTDLVEGVTEVRAGEAAVVSVTLSPLE